MLCAAIRLIFVIKMVKFNSVKFSDIRFCLLKKEFYLLRGQLIDL